MKKIVTVLGARPQFIKAAVLSRIIRQRGEIEEVMVHTGQHFDDNMSAIFFRELGIPGATYNLEVNNMGHGAMTGKMMEKLEPILHDENPDLVVVYGDTNSTLAGALVARKMGIPVAHVEAGLRSHNMKMPEEINRILTDRISDLLFCPTPRAVENLQVEGFDSFGVQVIQTGDIMKDSVSYFQDGSQNSQQQLNDLGIDGAGFVLATIHRQENTIDPKKLSSIFEGLDRIQEKTPVVMPLHPRTKAAMKDFGIESKIYLIDPVGYGMMQGLLQMCFLVVTDSGGLQKEAYFHKKPSLVVRPQTEWVELVDHGLALLVDADSDRLVELHERMMEREFKFDQNLYGEAPGEKIYREIMGFLSGA